MPRNKVQSISITPAQLRVPRSDVKSVAGDFAAFWYVHADLFLLQMDHTHYSVDTSLLYCTTTGQAVHLCDSSLSLLCTDRLELVTQNNNVLQLTV